MVNSLGSPAFHCFERPMIDGYLKQCQQRLDRFGLSDEDVYDAVKSACDFFRIPMPCMILDLTKVENGQTMFMNLAMEVIMTMCFVSIWSSSLI